MCACNEEYVKKLTLWKLVSSSSLTFLRTLTAHSCTCRRIALYTCA